MIIKDSIYSIISKKPWYNTNYPYFNVDSTGKNVEFIVSDFLECIGANIDDITIDEVFKKSFFIIQLFKDDENIVGRASMFTMFFENKHFQIRWKITVTFNGITKETTLKPQLSVDIKFTNFSNTGELKYCKFFSEVKKEKVNTVNNDGIDAKLDTLFGCDDDYESYDDPYIKF